MSSKLYKTSKYKKLQNTEYVSGEFDEVTSVRESPEYRYNPPLGVEVPSSLVLVWLFLVFSFEVVSIVKVIVPFWV